MARALHAHTAALPLVEVRPKPCTGPGLNTEDAICNGINMAVVGGVDALILQIAASCVNSPTIFLTGGDAAPFRYTLAAAMNFRFYVRPLLTLEGIRLAAEALP
jgi:type III pantothenate kinase